MIPHATDLAKTIAICLTVIWCVSTLVRCGERASACDSVIQEDKPRKEVVELKKPMKDEMKKPKKK